MIISYYFIMNIIWMIYLFYYKLFYSFLLEYKIKLFAIIFICGSKYKNTYCFLLRCSKLFFYIIRKKYFSVIVLYTAPFARSLGYAKTVVTIVDVHVDRSMLINQTC